MTIQAIETRYAGCKFRSRLEARWAVAFDHLGIRWEYEPQGFICSARLSLRTDKISYLPDFWFPDLKFHGEVKGSLTEPELLRLLDLAASLGDPADSGGCNWHRTTHDSVAGYDLVIFGNIPAPNNGEEGSLPTRLHMHKGGLNASGWTGEILEHCWNEHQVEIAADYGGDLNEICQDTDGSPSEIIQLLTQGCGASRFVSYTDYLRWMGAYTAARSARFEHGQQG